MSGSASSALRRALKAEFGSFAGLLEVDMRGVEEWASVTFTGERHTIAVRLEGRGAGAAMARFRDGLEDREFDLRGHVLIDIAVTGLRRDDDVAAIELETLTVAVD